MVINFGSSDDKNSTQLTGKKLKDRGVVIEGQELGSQYLEIDVDGPNVGIDADVEQDGQEFFQNREYGKENEMERDERLKKEMQAARRQQQEQQKQQQQQPENNQQASKNEKFDQMRDGIELSQNEGTPVTRDVDQKAKIQEARTAQHQGKKLTPEQAESISNSVPATQVQDQRGRGGEDRGLF